MTQVVDAVEQTTEAAVEREPGLRERKKRATRRALQRATLELVADRGLDAVTVDEIAAAADVSTRTFFNYFTSKEEALSATDPDALADTLAAFAARPAQESVLQALRVANLRRAEQMSQDTEFWHLRAKVIRHYPELGTRLVGASLAADQQIARAIADRMGVDPRTDPRPILLAGATSAAKRAAMGLWFASAGERDLADVMAECYDVLAHLDDAA